MDSQPKDNTGTHITWTVDAPVQPWTPYSHIGRDDEHGAASLIEGPQVVTITAIPEGHPEIHEVVIEAALIDGRYRIGRFEVRGQWGGVSAESIRKVPIATLMRGALVNRMRINMFRDPAIEGSDDVVWWDPIADDDGAAVDIIYYLARAIGEPPTKAVAEHFGISSVAAAGRVRRRRAAGQLPPTTRGKVS